MGLTCHMHFKDVVFFFHCSQDLGQDLLIIVSFKIVGTQEDLAQSRKPWPFLIVLTYGETFTVEECERPRAQQQNAVTLVQ